MTIDKLELAKERLKNSITRLETAIESKFTKLEIENSRLLTEMNKLKKDSIKAEKPMQTDLLKTNEIELTLDELKKLAG